MNHKARRLSLRLPRLAHLLEVDPELAYHIDILLKKSDEYHLRENVYKYLEEGDLEGANDYLLRAEKEIDFLEKFAKYRKGIETLPPNRRVLIEEKVRRVLSEGERDHSHAEILAGMRRALEEGK